MKSFKARSYSNVFVKTEQRFSFHFIIDDHMTDERIITNRIDIFFSSRTYHFYLPLCSINP